MRLRRAPPRAPRARPAPGCGRSRPESGAPATIAERLSAYHRELEPTGVSLEDLVETTARILVQVATGETPD